MAYKVTLSTLAQKDLDSLPPDIARRVLTKVLHYANTSNPLQFAKRLKDLSIGEYRFRVGDYRITFDLSKETIQVLRVGHRKEIYDF